MRVRTIVGSALSFSLSSSGALLCMCQLMERQLGTEGHNGHNGKTNIYRQQAESKVLSHTSPVPVLSCVRCSVSESPTWHKLYGVTEYRKVEREKDREGQ